MHIDCFFEVNELGVNEFALNELGSVRANNNFLRFGRAAGGELLVAAEEEPFERDYRHANPNFLRFGLTSAVLSSVRERATVTNCPPPGILSLMPMPIANMDENL
uniref:Uncharacterized protein n=1 Tax=Globodera rostochiensis TaxID=31243 RepID=A0A914I7B8_GLORO